GQTNLDVRPTGFLPRPQGQKCLRKGSMYGCSCNHYISKTSRFFCLSRLCTSKCPVSIILLIGNPANGPPSRPNRLAPESRSTAWNCIGYSQTSPRRLERM